MKVHKLIQGSPEWLAYRREHFNASDAAAMMGVSPFTTRTELLQQIKTGILPDVDAMTQERFDDGHRFEALARPYAEKEIGEDLYPQVGSDGMLSASFDGLTMDDSIAWEHKTLNSELAATMARGCVGAELYLMYQIQMEQQLAVSGAEKVLFTASQWDGDELVEMHHCWYTPNLELRKSIMAGWNQFAVDLETFVPEVVEVQPVGRTPETLPALHIEVTGKVTASNLAEYKAHAMAVFASVNRELVTDQDFADAKKAIKWAGDIEGRLEAAKEHALSQTQSIDVLFKTITDISEEARRVRLELTNIVKTRDTNLRKEIVMDGQAALNEHIAACNKRIGLQLIPAIGADFANAIKGMSKFQNMRDAVATELARSKIAANEWADKIALNLKTINEQEGFGHLFYDQASLALKEPEFLAMVIKTRISEHKADEAAKIARIQAEEKYKAEAAAQARADAEIAQAKAASEAVIAKAQEARPAVVAEVAPFAEDVCIIQASLPTAPDLKLGQICTRLGFQVTADFLKSLGFEPAGRERAAVLFHESDFPKICDALVRHITGVRQGVSV
jgi:putative phage-type endonuclease